MQRMIFLTLIPALLAMIGCAEQAAPTTAKTTETVDSAGFLLKSEPEKFQEVIAARKDARDGDEIALVGRIGGERPWVEGRAAFTIVDNSLKPCPPEEGCPTPWDYCCELDKLATSMAFVKIVDDKGAVVKADARKLLNVKELSTVVVQGKAKRDEKGNLTVIANKVFVKKK